MGFMDSEFEFSFWFKNKKAILKFITYTLVNFFVVPFQLLVYYFSNSFGKSKIFQRVRKISLKKLLFATCWTAGITYPIVYLIADYINPDTAATNSGLVTLAILSLGLLILCLILIVGVLEVAVNLIISAAKTLFNLMFEVKVR